LRTDRRTDKRTDGRTEGRTDGRTDMTKLLVDFRNFAKCLKITSKVVENYETSVFHNETENKKCGGKTALFHFLLLKLLCGAVNQKCSRKTQDPNCTLVKKYVQNFSNQFFKQM